MIREDWSVFAVIGVSDRDIDAEIQRLVSHELERVMGLEFYGVPIHAHRRLEGLKIADASFSRASASGPDFDQARRAVYDAMTRRAHPDNPDGVARLRRFRSAYLPELAQ